MSLLVLPFLILGCTTQFTGSVTGDVPNGTNVVLLWPVDGNLGKVGGVAEVESNGKFELIAQQPDNQHDGLEFGTLVLYDGEPGRGETLDLDQIGKVVGAAPRHYIVDSNATCKVGGCETDTFERGMHCGVCDDDGDCKPTACKNLELIANDLPLSLDWAIPDVKPIEGVFSETGTHVAYVEETEDAIGLFPIGDVGGTAFRTDLLIDEITGVHLLGERIAARVTNGFTLQRGHVRDFEGRNFLELDQQGSTLLAGPLISPDGEYAAAIWSDEGLSVYDIDAGVEVTTVPLDQGTWRVDWSPMSTVAYAVPEVGGTPVAAPLPGEVAADFPECSDVPGSSTVDVCTGDMAAVIGVALGHPVLLHRPCEAATWADSPRSATAVAVRSCAPTPPTQTTGTVR